MRTDNEYEGTDRSYESEGKSYSECWKVECKTFWALLYLHKAQRLVSRIKLYL